MRDQDNIISTLFPIKLEGFKFLKIGLCSFLLIISKFSSLVCTLVYGS